jgi:hypothetical protein
MLNVVCLTLINKSYFIFWKDILGEASYFLWQSCQNLINNRLSLRWIEILWNGWVGIILLLRGISGAFDKEFATLILIPLGLFVILSYKKINEEKQI